MRKMLKMSIAAAMVMGIGSVSAQADGINILSNVQANGEIRLRYENVDTDDGVNGNANAYTSRLTVGASADLLDTDWLSAYVEMTNVANLNHNYNDGATNRNLKDTVVDPEQTRLTQSYIDIKYGDTNLRIGRQLINLDNQRFLGAVGWRQMFQTFDAITVTNKSIENLNIFASYVTRVNAVSLDNQNSSRDLLVNVSYKVMPELKVTVYSYMLGSVHDTYGIALTGKVGVSDDVKISYRAEYATQGDPSMEEDGIADKDTVNADADYMRFDLGVKVSDFSAGIGYEELSGANGTDTRFSTPYATLHGKNGWADAFLGNGGNPTNGLEDLSFNVGYNAGELGSLTVVYHDYSSEVGSTDYGTEIDAVYKNKIPGVNGVTGMLKYADFDADTAGGMTDNTKIWLMLGYKFASN